MSSGGESGQVGEWESEKGREHVFAVVPVVGAFDDLKCSECGLVISENQAGEVLGKCAGGKVGE